MTMAKNQANHHRCALCQPITLAAIKAGITLLLEPHWLAWKSLAYVQKPCGLCTIVYESLRIGLASYMNVLLFRYNKFSNSIVVAATTSSFLKSDIQVELLCDEKGEAWMSSLKSDIVAAFLAVNRGVGDLKKDDIVRRMTSPNAGLEECLSIAKRWLTECSAVTTPISDFVPSLLVDVELTKLVSPKDGNLHGPEPLRYAALSYCWGKDAFFCTTSKNIQAMRQSIPWSELPRTIQDAIVVTRYLGLKYIWIDSLCILQGADHAAHSDWMSELKSMGEIYQFAYVTISAESAPNAHVGILNDRKAPSVSSCAIQESPASSDVVYLTQHVIYGGHDANFVPEVKEPLHSRGWALQESILSPRLLGFGTHELSWRCRHVANRESLCEAWPHGSFIPKVTKKIMGHDRLKWLVVESRMIYRDWEDIVEDYSTRLLTKVTDKLHAIAGLAELAQRATNERYISGAWTATARDAYKLKGILWVHQQAKPSFSHAKGFKAPSWSWASVEGPIRFLRVSKADNVVVKAGRRGSLSFRGILVKIDTIRLQNFGTYYGGYDKFLPWANLPATLKTYLDDLSEIPEKFKKGNNGNPLELINSYFLALGRDAGSPDIGTGLILLPTRTGSNHYRRVGAFEGLDMDRFRTGWKNNVNNDWRLAWRNGREQTVTVV